MKLTDASKSKYIIGNMIIPVTDEIQTKLKGDYSMERLKKVFPAVFNREHIQFLDGSVTCVDGEGLKYWHCRTYPHASEISDIDRKLNELLSSNATYYKAFSVMASALVEMRDEMNKPSLLKRMFKRKPSL